MFSSLLPLVTGSRLLFAAAFGADDSQPTARYRVKAGRAHPQFVLPAVDGSEPIGLSTYRGKKVLLVHFASWSKASRQALPAWNEATRQAVDAGQLVVVGVAQEQDAGRCRLLLQWRQIDWPVAIDALNLVGVAESLPIVTAIDEHGIVSKLQPSIETIADDFLKRTYRPPKNPVPLVEAILPDPKGTRRAAGEAQMAGAWEQHGSALVLSGREILLDEAVDAYRQAVQLEDAVAAYWFRLGVAYSLRSRSTRRTPTDGHEALAAFKKAVKLAPDHPIYRQRMEEHDPASTKSAAYYKWVARARKETAERGERPPGDEPDTPTSQPEGGAPDGPQDAGQVEKP